MTAAETAQQVNSTKADPLVLLVVPPFQALQTPSLGVSQLTANVRAAGVRSSVVYLNLHFAGRIGTNLYEWLAASGPLLIGDFIFSRVVYDRSEGDVERYVEDVLRKAGAADELEQRFPGQTAVQALEWLIEQAREFIHDDAMADILDKDPWLVGFSSTFQANCSSIAAIAELKKRRPEILTVMGGANCENEMGQELRRILPEIDYIGRGECDKTFVQLVRALRNGESGSGIDGFLARDGETTTPSSPLNGEELDAQPHPDFDDFFGQIKAWKLADKVSPGLAMETSRGCWWGQKSHCTFCAFNRDGMIFRSKNADRAMEELSSQVERYGLDRMEMTDNILDMSYFKSLLKRLADEPRAQLFWETKSNLSNEQVRLLGKAGVKWIQPGIESLSDKTLKLMRKGSSQLQNIQLLKACGESGIRITWNWLFGFPGENEEELPRLQQVVESVHHLEPPSSAPVLYLERFAPYHTSPQEWGLEPIRPAKAYSHVYPYSAETLDKIAFFFDCDFFSSKEGGAAHKKLTALVENWQKNYRWSHLLAVPRRKSLILLDTRSNRKRYMTRLTGLRREIYEFCGRIRGPREVVRAFESRARPDEITSILKSFVDDALMLESENRYLSLATDPNLGYRTFPVLFPGGSVLPARQPEPTTLQRWARKLRTPPSEIARRLRRKITFGLARRLTQPGAAAMHDDRSEPPAPRTSPPSEKTLSAT